MWEQAMAAALREVSDAAFKLARTWPANWPGLQVFGLLLRVQALEANMARLEKQVARIERTRR